VAAIVWLGAIAALLALGDTKPATYLPLTIGLIAYGAVESHRLSKRREAAAISAWLDSHPKPKLPRQ